MKKKSIFIMMLMSVILSSVSFPAYAATDSFGNKIDWEEDYGYEDAAGSEILKETEIEESTEYSFSEQVKVLEQMQQYETPQKLAMSQQLFKLRPEIGARAISALSYMTAAEKKSSGFTDRMIGPADRNCQLASTP